MSCNSLHPFPSCLDLKLTFRKNVTSDQQEKFWDSLVQWLEHRQAFLGGTPSCAFVLFARYEPQLASRLTRWLERQPSIGRWRLQLALFELPEAKSPESHDARLEALCSLQQHLVERLAQTTQALSRLRWSAR
jgi:hypothetical protein